MHTVWLRTNNYTSDQSSQAPRYRYWSWTEIFWLRRNNLQQQKQAAQKINAILRIRNLISSRKAYMLIQAFVISRFFYCPIIWMFCNKQSLALINKVYQRALRTQFMRFDLSLEELLQLSGRVSIHTKHLQALLTEIYKFLNKLNPSFMWNLFELKRTKYNLKSLNCLKLPKAKTRKFRINSVIFRGSLL